LAQKGSDGNQHQSDRDLVVRLLQGERQAFDLFFEIYYARLYRYCRVKLRDAVVAEDIAQQTVTKGMLKIDTYRGEASLYTWLCAICRREISSWLKKHKLQTDTVLLADDFPEIRHLLENMEIENAEHPDVAMEKEHLGRLVRLTLDYLPAGYGEALQWKYVEGLSVEEIAEKMCTGTIAMQSLLARARRTFRQAFKEVADQAGLMQEVGGA